MNLAAIDEYMGEIHRLVSTHSGKQLIRASLEYPSAAKNYLNGFMILAQRNPGNPMYISHICVSDNGKVLTVYDADEVADETAVCLALQHFDHLTMKYLIKREELM